MKKQDIIHKLNNIEINLNRLLTATDFPLPATGTPDGESNWDKAKRVGQKGVEKLGEGIDYLGEKLPIFFDSMKKKLDYFRLGLKEIAAKRAAEAAAEEDAKKLIPTIQRNIKAFVDRMYNIVKSSAVGAAFIEMTKKIRDKIYEVYEDATWDMTDLYSNMGPVNQILFLTGSLLLIVGFVYISIDEPIEKISSIRTSFINSIKTSISKIQTIWANMSGKGLINGIQSIGQMIYELFAAPFKALYESFARAKEARFGILVYGAFAFMISSVFLMYNMNVNNGEDNA